MTKFWGSTNWRQNCLENHCLIPRWHLCLHNFYRREFKSGYQERHFQSLMGPSVMTRPWGCEELNMNWWLNNNIRKEKDEGKYIYMFCSCSNLHNIQRVLTKCGPLEKRIENHFSILALRTSWTVWKDKKVSQYATGDQWRNNSRKNEEMEPKQKQHPVVDVTTDRARSEAIKSNIT